VRLSLVIVALLALCGCAAVGDVTPTTPTTPTRVTPIVTVQTTSMIAPTAPPPPTRTPEVFRDCAWLGLAETWLDANENGVREGGEPSLPGVTIVASDGRVVLSEATGADGRVELRTGLRSCTDPGLVVAVTVPPGYRLTTAATLPSQAWPTPYRFGLAPVSPGSGTPTRTTPP